MNIFRQATFSLRGRGIFWVGYGGFLALQKGVESLISLELSGFVFVRKNAPLIFS
jgi:hypothetical protein